MHALFRQFSFPGGIPSHVAPETPGSIHEGGELGYVLSHAYGAAMDNPDLVVAAVVGDGEFETGPLAASWHANKFVDPVHRRCGAADPAPQRLQDRQPDRAGPDPSRRAREPARAATATRSSPSRATTPPTCTARWRAAIDQAHDTIRRDLARRPRGRRRRAPAVADDPDGHAQGLDRPASSSTAYRSRAPGVPTRCRCRGRATNDEHRAQLEEWMRSYRAEELFRRGRPVLAAELRALAPRGNRRMSANPHANGGLLRQAR